MYVLIWFDFKVSFTSNITAFPSTIFRYVPWCLNHYQSRPCHYWRRWYRHAVSIAIICVCDSVCLSVCLSARENQNGWKYNHQTWTGIVHHDTSLPINIRSKGQRSQDQKCKRRSSELCALPSAHSLVYISMLCIGRLLCMVCITGE